MTTYTVGDNFAPLADRPEGTYFDITESGPIWCFNYNNPSEKEIADVSAGSTFEIRSMVLYGVLWIFVRCGSQPWAEAPFDPLLCRTPVLQEIDEGDGGYGLMLLMVDAKTSILRHVRMIGLGNKFSIQLRKELMETLAAPPDPGAVQRAQLMYSTEQMVAMCRNVWRASNA